LIPPEIDSAADDESRQVTLNADLVPHFSGDKISVSLKYFVSSCECFSKWKPKELKALTALVDKLSDRTPEQVASNTKLCHGHNGPPERKRFKRPLDVSPDLRFYGLAVIEKARVHGFFAGSVFFLVWLDRKHECFASKS